MPLEHSQPRKRAHVEKELLVIVFSWDKFDQYVYGRHITVQSDQTPLEIITKKSMLLSCKIIDLPEDVHMSANGLQEIIDKSLED